MGALHRAETLGFTGPPDIALRTMAALETGDTKTASRVCSASADDFCLAIVDHALGKQNDAETHLEKLRAAGGDGGAFQYAAVYAQWGRQEDALHWLEMAYHQHDPSFFQLRIYFLFDPIRNTPRFQAIDRQMNFPP